LEPDALGVHNPDCETTYQFKEVTMGEKHPKVDEYIARSSEFARPILTHFRNLVHQTCPEVEEAMKWSFPHFMYKGMLCSMASFKNHCAIGFWKEALLFGKGASHGTIRTDHFLFGFAPRSGNG
jgi:hypothetical protein